MKKTIIFMLFAFILFPSCARGESGSYQDLHDQWYSEGYEYGKKAEKYDPVTSFEAVKKDAVQPKYDEMKAVAKHEEAEEFLKAAEDGFYSGYRAGYYREKESELVELLEKKAEKDIKISSFMFGRMEEGPKDMVVEETADLKIPAVEGEKNYFGYMFDYSDNQVGEKLVVVINLPGPPKKDLGPGFYPATNSVISEHKIDYGSGHFANKWYFSKDDLPGKYRLNVYIGGKLVKRLWFNATQEK